MTGCEKVVFHTKDHGLCVGCAKRLKASGQGFEDQRLVAIVREAAGPVTVQGRPFP